MFNAGRRGLIAGTELKWLFGKQPLVPRSLQREEGLGKRGHRIGGLRSKSLCEESVILPGTVRKSPPAVALYGFSNEIPINSVNFL